MPKPRLRNLRTDMLLEVRDICSQEITRVSLVIVQVGGTVAAALAVDVQTAVVSSSTNNPSSKSW